MTIGELNALLAAEPALASYKVRVLLKRNDDDLAQVPIDRIEFDERDADLNLVIGESKSSAGVGDFLPFDSFFAIRCSTIQSSRISVKQNFGFVHHLILASNRAIIGSQLYLRSIFRGD